MPLNPICAKTDIHRNYTSQDQTLDAGRYDPEIHRPDANFSAMAFSEERCVKQMLLEGCVDFVRILEILLGVIVEACQRPNVPDRVQHDPVDAEDNDKACEEKEGVLDVRFVVES